MKKRKLNFCFAIVLFILSIGCTENRDVLTPHEKDMSVEFVYNEKNKLTSFGTLFQSKKDGIWSYLNENEELIEQVYFQNDTPKYKINPLIEFKIIADTIKGYTILVPKNWLAEYPLNSALLSGISKDHPSEIKPSFNLVFNSSMERNLDSLKQINKTDFNKSVDALEIIKEDQNLIVFRVKYKGKVLTNSVKLVLGKKGYFILSCLSTEEDFKSYSTIFSTIINSFQSLE